MHRLESYERASPHQPIAMYGCVVSPLLHLVVTCIAIPIPEEDGPGILRLLVLTFVMHPGVTHQLAYASSCDLAGCARRTKIRLVIAHHRSATLQPDARAS